MQVLSVIPHPIDRKTARANSSPQKSNARLAVFARYASERSEGLQVYRTIEEKRLLLTDVHKTADNEFGYLN